MMRLNSNLFRSAQKPNNVHCTSHTCTTRCPEGDHAIGCGPPAAVTSASAHARTLLLLHPAQLLCSAAGLTPRTGRTPISCVYVTWRGQASRFASGGEGTGGRARAYRFERSQIKLQAHSPWQTCAGKSGHEHWVAASRLSSEPARDSSPTENVLTCSSPKRAAHLHERTRRGKRWSPPKTCQMVVVLLRRRRSRASRPAPHVDQSVSCRAQRGF
jgi:hypothetical protein